VRAAVAVAGTVAVGGYITEAQVNHHYRLILEWPQHFEAASGVAWVAVVAFVAEATIRHIRGRRRHGGDRHGRPDS
jgi:hypothetical protein